MKPLEISRQTACQLVLNAQLLTRQSELDPGKDGLNQIFDQLGYIQIDTINIVERSHNHTLWTRLNGYNNVMLHDLQAMDHKIFEYWGHAMSYLPLSDYRYFLPKMKRFKNPSHPWVLNMYKQGSHLLDPVIDRIREEGPLASKDFSRPEGQKGGTWWDWKPAKFALEYLFWRGDLMIAERRNFQKVYDLTERILPSDIDTSLPTEKEIAEYLVKRALKAMGIASEKEIQKFMQPDAVRDSDFRAVNREVITETIKEFIEENVISKVNLDKVNGNDNYLLSEILDKINIYKNSEQSVIFLSPFDNLIIQRERIKRLFDFEYTLECYVPAPKRVHGYFVFPVLYGNQFVGRIDPKADRKSKTLILNNISFEEGFEITDEFLEKFSRKISDLTKFNQCNSISIEKTKPSKLKSIIKTKIRKLQD
jgi:uncharacterized protein YcaQ